MYICGNPEMILNVEATLMDRGFPGVPREEGALLAEGQARHALDVGSDLSLLRPTVATMRLLRLGCLAMAVLAMSACGAFGPTPSLLMTCTAFIVPDAVLGHVHVATNEAWLEAEDGRHLSVVWPAEVEIRPDGLYSRETGERMVRDGERLHLIQTESTSAAGTTADPYRPGWCSFYDVF